MVFRRLISEQTIRAQIAKGEKTLELLKGDIVTPLAAEVALENGIQLLRVAKMVEPVENPSAANADVASPIPRHELVVAFGSDHGGFQFKEILKKHAGNLGFRAIDLGTTNEEPCDYPDYAYAVAKAVAIGEAWRGVVIDGAGIGSCVVANKVPGIRAACCHNEFVARNAREHNDTNVLTLGSRVTGSEVCKEIIRVWLETSFAGGRHLQRVNKIVDVESKYLKR